MLFLLFELTEYRNNGIMELRVFRSQWLRTEVSMCQLAQDDELLLEQVLLEVLVGHHTADAILAEAGGLDAQLAQDVEHGAEDVAVALELNDDQGTDIGIALVLHIMEMHVEVDGEPLRLAVVDECNAVEAVADGGVNVAHAPMYELLEEVLVPVLAGDLLRGHFDTLLLGASVVVLGLDLQEGYVAVEIGPDTNLLARCPPVVMLHVEVVALGIPIGGHVVGYLAAVNDLGIVLPLCHTKQLHQFLLAGHELSVRPVHQADFGHLLQRDGFKLSQQLVNLCTYIHLKSRYWVQIYKKYVINTLLIWFFRGKKLLLVTKN